MAVLAGYKREFGPATTIEEFISANNDDCELPDVHPSISDDGKTANILYKQPVSRQQGRYNIVALQSDGTTWAASSLCCNQTFAVSGAPDQFKMAASTNAQAITAAWVVSATNSSAGGTGNTVQVCEDAIDTKSA